MGDAVQLVLDWSRPAEPQASLAEAFDSERNGCAHDVLTCSPCLADVAVRAIRDYILDELADDDRFEGWFRADPELEDMPRAQVLAQYLVDVILPSARRVETVNAGGLL